MLALAKLDKVELRRDIEDKGTYHLILALHRDLADIHGVKWSGKYTKKGYVQTFALALNGQRLVCGVSGHYGSRCVFYSFNGSIDPKKCEEATYSLGDFSFLGAVFGGRVKTLELAFDIACEGTMDYLFHLKGAKSSAVCVNQAVTGYSYYSGSRISSLQLVAYDKAQELRDKGRKCPFKQMLRLELRVRNWKGSLSSLIVELVENDPFQKVWVVSFAAALAHKTSIHDWPIFLSACKQMGVARALQLFPGRHKTFTKYLESLNVKQLVPSVPLFKQALMRVDPYSCIWTVLKGHHPFFG